MSLIFPPEIWVLIVSFVGSSIGDTDLLSLLTVSRQMHAYAEPELLRKVYLSIESAHDDSQSPVIQFHRCVSSPQIYRQRLVQALSLDFIEEVPFPSEVQALELLIPTFTNLRSLALKFARYTPSIHGHLRLLEEGVGGLLLRDLEISVNEADAALDVTGLLRSQPSIRYLELSGAVQVAGDKNLLPELRSLGAFIYNPFQRPYIDGITHLRTTFGTRTHFAFTPPAATLTTLSCIDLDPTTFHAFLPMAPNLRYLEIYLQHNAREDMNLWSPLRHTKITHIRFPVHVKWISDYAISNDVFALDGFPPSLQCVDLALGPPSPRDESTYSLRWHRGRKPILVRWECADFEIWRADWERDVRCVSR